VELIDERSGVEMVPRDGCLRLIADEVVGRLGFLSGGRPEILPVNYILDGDAVVFRTAAGTKLAGAIRGPVVFEVDRFDQVRRSGWSVIVHGDAQVVTAFDAPALLARVLELPIDPWARGNKPYLVRITPRSITGRRVGAGSAELGRGASTDGPRAVENEMPG
jgi:nitroimidazol reductase NimA-like FMN-containing flavoprotein (pyridoxamine 5'-phosphate oxidase superfamily)